jgi:hypothetical protein
MVGYFSFRASQMILLAARSAAVRGDESDLILTSQFCGARKDRQATTPRVGGPYRGP